MSAVSDISMIFERPESLQLSVICDASPFGSTLEFAQEQVASIMSLCITCCCGEGDVIQASLTHLQTICESIGWRDEFAASTSIFIGTEPRTKDAFIVLGLSPSSAQNLT